MVAERLRRRRSAPARPLLNTARRNDECSRPVPNGDTGGRASPTGETGLGMKHSSIRELFYYWNERRGRRPAPERGDIAPGDIRGVLADTFILAFDAPESHPFRIAGTRVCALFGRELKDDAFLDLWSAESRPLVRDLLSVVAYETIGVVAGAQAAGSDGAVLDF